MHCTWQNWSRVFCLLEVPFPREAHGHRPGVMQPHLGLSSRSSSHSVQPNILEGAMKALRKCRRSTNVSGTTDTHRSRGCFSGFLFDARYFHHGPWASLLWDPGYHLGHSLFAFSLIEGSTNVAHGCTRQKRNQNETKQQQ